MIVGWGRYSLDSGVDRGRSERLGDLWLDVDGGVAGRSRNNPSHVLVHPLPNSATEKSVAVCVGISGSCEILAVECWHDAFARNGTYMWLWVGCGGCEGSATPDQLSQHVVCIQFWPVPNKQIMEPHTHQCENGNPVARAMDKWSDHSQYAPRRWLASSPTKDS